MEDEIETPQQRQARIRREKREAKVKGTAQERLEKITRLSGRTPESSRNESPASTAISTPQRTASPAIPSGGSTPASAMTPGGGSQASAEQVQAQQQAFFRALLGDPQALAAMSSQQQQQQQPPPQQQQPFGGLPAGEPDQEDPMLKMLTQMLSGMGGMEGMNNDPNAAPLPPPQLSSLLNSDMISQLTGLPPWVTNMFMGGAGNNQPPPSPAVAAQQQKATRIWTVLHILFATLTGLYMLLSLEKLTSTFGSRPPAPATIQNPVSIFILGEAILHGAQAVLPPSSPFKSSATKQGLWFWIQTGRDLVRDASVMVFILGIHSWMTQR